jgi:HAD superfamily hydrolase (TIGR01549 family)
MSRIEAVLFDLGNTLIYFNGDWPDVLAQADFELARYLQQAGLPLDQARFLQEFRARMLHYYAEREMEFTEYTTAYILRTLLAELGHPDLPQALLAQALEQMYAISQAYWLPEVETHPTLARLRARGFRLGIISNAGDDADVQALVDQADLRPYFDVVLSSAGTGIRKPNPCLFEMALQTWGIPPAQALMVGDTLGADILGARNAGIYSVWVSRRADTPANRAHADTIRPDAVIENLAELIGLLEGFE